MAAIPRSELLRARRQLWAGHLHTWKQSGLSQAQYCRQHQLSAATFAWWKRRLATAAKRVRPTASANQSGGKDGLFVELAVSGRDAGATAGQVIYEILLPDHRRLRLGPHFEPERVRQLLQVLEGQC